MSAEEWSDLLAASRAGLGRCFAGRLRFDAADLGRAGARTFVSCMSGEHPKQLPNVDSLLGSQEKLLLVSCLRKKKKKKCLAALLAKTARVARMCNFILGSGALLGVAPPLRGLLI